MSIEWLSVRQAAQRLANVSVKTVYKLFDRGELEGVRVAGAIRIRAASVAAYLEAHGNTKPAAQAVTDAQPAARPRRRPRCLAGGFHFLPPRS